jgi:hypothetical protein
MAEPDSKSVPGTPTGANLPITVMAFYKFHRVEAPSTLQTHLRSLLDVHEMKGTILVAKANGVWISRPFEGADRDFVIVSSIDQ